MFRRLSSQTEFSAGEGPGEIPETTKDIGVDFAPWAKKHVRKAEKVSMD